MNREAALAALAEIRAASAALEAALGEEAPAIPAPARRVANGAAFFDVVRKAAPLGPSLSQSEVDGCTRILKACAGLPLAWAAYILATDVHETAGQMRPIPEYGKGAGKAYGKPGRNAGQIAYGRGDVQLTWDDNYERADRELDLGGRLVANYELALDPEISAKVLVGGMTGGWFTGKSLADLLPSDRPATRAQFAGARPIVNGRDKADLIAGYAVTFQDALIAGGW